MQPKLRRTFVLTAMLLAFFAVETFGRTFVIRSAPPRYRHETAWARPSHRHVWVGGYWSWRDNRYDWIGGGWYLPPRGCHHWHAGYYRHVRDGWIWIDGFWN